MIIEVPSSCLKKLNTNEPLVMLGNFLQSSAGDGQDRAFADSSPGLCAFSLNTLTAGTHCKCRPIFIAVLVGTARITFKFPEADRPQILTITDDGDWAKREATRKLFWGHPFHPYLHVFSPRQAIWFTTLTGLFSRFSTPLDSKLEELSCSLL